LRVAIEVPQRGSKSQTCDWHICKRMVTVGYVTGMKVLEDPGRLDDYATTTYGTVLGPHGKSQRSQIVEGRFTAFSDEPLNHLQSLHRILFQVAKPSQGFLRSKGINVWMCLLRNNYLFTWRRTWSAASPERDTVSLRAVKARSWWPNAECKEAILSEAWRNDLLLIKFSSSFEYINPGIDF